MQVELGRLADIQIGYQVSGKIRPRTDDTHMLIQTVDVSDGGDIAWDRLARFTPDRKIGDRYTLLDGDVLFLAKGPRRIAAVVRHPLPHTLAVSTFYILRVRDEAVLLPEYLTWFLNVPGREALGAIEHQGTTMAFVPKEALDKLTVELPSTATQRWIADLDELRRREADLMVKLQEQRARMISLVAMRAMMTKEAR